MKRRQKAIITITETGGNNVKAELQFIPPVADDAKCTPACLLGNKLLAYATTFAKAGTIVEPKGGAS